MAPNFSTSHLSPWPTEQATHWVFKHPTVRTPPEGLRLVEQEAVGQAQPPFHGSDELPELERQSSTPGVGRGCKLAAACLRLLRQRWFGKYRQRMEWLPGVCTFIWFAFDWEYPKPNPLISLE